MRFTIETAAIKENKYGYINQFKHIFYNKY